MTGQICDGSGPPLSRCPEQPLARRRSACQAMPILGPDLPCQMLAQRLLAVRSEIIVEIPEPRLHHPNGNPDLGCCGAQPLCRALPGEIAVDGNVEALQALRQEDGSQVT